VKYFDLEPLWSDVLRVAHARRKWEDHIPPDSSIGADAVDIVGTAGEFLGALLMGAAEVPQPITGPDRGWDFEVGGIRVDVKSTFHLGDDVHLLLPIDEELRADLYVLAQIDRRRRRGRLLGWATRAEVKAAKRKTFLNRCRAIPASRLRSLDGLRLPSEAGA